MMSAVSCEYCEVERMYFTNALYPIRPYPVQVCSLCSTNSPCWLPFSPSANTPATRHVSNEADKCREESSSISAEKRQKNREREKDGQEGIKEPAKRENAKSPESLPVEKEGGLSFGIERILYGSTKKVTSQRKPPRPRPVFSPSQRQYLEKFFHTKPYLQKSERTKIAALLNLSEQQVKIWFQNRRVKRKNEMHQHLVDGCAPTTHGYLCSQCVSH